MVERTEEDRVAGRAIARTGLVIFAVLGLSLAALALLARHYASQRPPAPETYAVPAPPRIDPAPERELADYLAAQRAQLTAYRWIDRRRGLVQIPVERAMEIYVGKHRERGVP